MFDLKNVPGESESEKSLIRMEMLDHGMSEDAARAKVMRDVQRLRIRENMSTPGYAARIRAQDQRDKKLYGTCESENPQQAQKIHGDSDFVADEYHGY